MTLRYKFVLPINLILVLVLAASLAWEWRRQEATGMSLLRSRLGEEARFIQAASLSFGVTPRLAEFLRGFCHAIDASSSPEHQVALLDDTGKVLASAAEHARRPMDPTRLGGLGEGFWMLQDGGESFLVRVLGDSGRSVVVAESTRAVKGQVWANLTNQAGWYLGSAVLLLGAVNLVMRRAVLRPIRRLYRVARQLEQGQLGVQVDRPGSDELGALSDQFNAMSRALAEQAEDSKRELEAAHRVQSHLLPPPHFHLGCVEFAGRCIQKGPVGGDVLDVRLLAGDRVALLVADLSGHDIAAALYTAMFRAIVWREAEQAKTPGEVLARLNERLCQDLPGGHFATAFFGWFDPDTNRLHYANAGHPSAFLNPPTGCLRELESTGPLLGILPDLSDFDASVEVAPGSRLLVMTDGLTETRAPGGELLGADELAKLLVAGGTWEPKRLIEDFLARATAFRQGEPQQDDITVVLACYESPDVSDNTPNRESGGEQ
ncbi:MAG: PP2C family protein-serine/threonine phosphatase [Isosphaerales bacterium]